MNLSPWTEEDLKMHKVLDDLVMKSAKWEVTTTESVQLYRALVWYANLRTKMEGSIAEITRVVEPPKPEPEEKKKPRAKKAKAE